MSKAGKTGPKGATKMTSLPCQVLPGMFSTERQVLIKLPGGQEIDALVDRRSVVIAEEPHAGKAVDGFVGVFLVGYDKHTKQALVDLPQGSFTKGPRIHVPPEMLKET